MMIFDKFPSVDQAYKFAGYVRTHESLDEDDRIIVCLDRTTFDRHEVYPYEVDFPVVLVERLGSIEKEQRVEKLVARFGGEFSGT